MLGSLSLKLQTAAFSAMQCYSTQCNTLHSKRRGSASNKDGTSASCSASRALFDLSAGAAFGRCHSNHKHAGIHCIAQRQSALLDPRLMLQPMPRVGAGPMAADQSFHVCMDTMPLSGRIEPRHLIYTVELEVFVDQSAKLSVEVPANPRKPCLPACLLPARHACLPACTRKPCLRAAATKRLSPPLL